MFLTGRLIMPAIPPAGGQLENALNSAIECELIACVMVAVGILLKFVTGPGPLAGTALLAAILLVAVASLISLPVTFKALGSKWGHGVGGAADLRLLTQTSVNQRYGHLIQLYPADAGGLCGPR